LGAWTLLVIAKRMEKIGMLKQAKEVLEKALKMAEGIEVTWWRAKALSAIAEGMARVGEVERAVGIVEREAGLKKEILPSVLPILAWQARKGDGKSKEGFLRLFTLCGWSLKLAYRACGLLAWLYPEQG